MELHGAPPRPQGSTHSGAEQQEANIAFKAMCMCCAIRRLAHEMLHAHLLPCTYACTCARMHTCIHKCTHTHLRELADAQQAGTRGDLIAVRVANLGGRERQLAAVVVEQVAEVHKDALQARVCLVEDACGCMRARARVSCTVLTLWLALSGSMAVALRCPWPHWKPAHASTTSTHIPL